MSDLSNIWKSVKPVIIDFVLEIVHSVVSKYLSDTSIGSQTGTGNGLAQGAAHEKSLSTPSTAVD